MAQRITSTGIQNEIDLNLPSIIQTWSESPVLCSVLQMSHWLGLELDDDYECRRLENGRILFYSELPDGTSAQVLLSDDESSLVETEEEHMARLKQKAEADVTLVEQMMLQDVVVGDGNYSTSRAASRVLGTDLTGVQLLIALLLAEKMRPADVWKRSGYSASLFLSEVAKMKKNGFFDGWSS